MKLKGVDRDELKALIKDALKEALVELVKEGLLEVKVTEKLAEPTLIETEPAEPTPTTLNETEPIEPIKVEPAEPTPTTLNETESVEPIKDEPVEPAPPTLIETETAKAEPAEPSKVEPTEPIDLEPLRVFIFSATTDQLNDFILNSDELFNWLHGAGVYPDILQDRETLWGLIKDAVELGCLKLQVSVNFFPDPDDDPAGWVVGAGKNKDAAFHWNECRQGIKEGYLTLKRYNEWLTPHDFLNMLLHIKDYNARLHFIYDLAVLETAPELANPQTLSHLRKFRLDYPTPPPNREIPISSLVDRITGRWGQGCGLGDDERTERVLTYLNTNLKVTPPDEGVDGEPPENPLASFILSADGGGGDDDEVAQARQILKDVFVGLARALLPDGWETMPMRDLQRHCAPLLQLVHKDPTLKALAIKARFINPQEL